MTQREKLIELIHTAIISARDNYGMPFSEDIADFLLANGVIVPPCKVGDKVYQIKPSLRERYAIIEWSIRYVECYAAEIHFCDFPYTHFAFTNDIGKTVFFTREEAESALEKMKGKQDNGEM